MVFVDCKAGKLREVALFFLCGEMHCYCLRNQREHAELEIKGTELKSACGFLFISILGN